MLDDHMLILIAEILLKLVLIINQSIFILRFYIFRKENTFDMLGEDSLVLGRLIYTLGVVMYSAINSPVSTLPLSQSCPTFFNDEHNSYF